MKISNGMNYKFKTNAMTNSVSKFIVVIFCCVFFVLNGGVALAQSPLIYFEGPKDAVAPNSDITVGIFLDTVESINAFDFEISYPRKNKFSRL